MWQPVNGQELLDVLVSVVALTDFHQAGKIEFHPGFDFTRRNVITTRFQTLRQLFGTAEHPHRLAADIHLEKKRVALTGLHAINLHDDRMNRTPFFGR
jgi:DNA gyrase/topoisomerase IV subunit A